MYFSNYIYTIFVIINTEHRFQPVSTAPPPTRFEPLSDTRVLVAIVALIMLIIAGLGLYLLRLPDFWGWTTTPAGASKRVDLAPSYVVDLDTGSLENNARTDLWWHFVKTGERYLDARNGAAFARIDEKQDFGKLDAAQLAQLNFSLRTLEAQGPDAPLKDGARFAVRTSEGKLARLRVITINAPPRDHLQIEWTLFATAGDSASNKKNQVRDWRGHIDKARQALREKQPDEARRMNDEALAGAEAQGESGAVLALALHHTGALSWSLRDLDVARTRMERAAELIDQVPSEKVHRLVGNDDAYLAADIHRWVGNIHRDQGRRKEALEEMLKARKAFEQAPDITGRYPGTRILMQHSILSSIGHAHCALRDKSATLAAFVQAHAAIAGNPGMAGNARGDMEQIAKIETSRMCGD